MKEKRLYSIDSINRFSSGHYGVDYSGDSENLD